MAKIKISVIVDKRILYKFREILCARYGSYYGHTYIELDSALKAHITNMESRIESKDNNVVDGDPHREHKENVQFRVDEDTIDKFRLLIIKLYGTNRRVTYTELNAALKNHIRFLEGTDYDTVFL